MYYQYLKKSMGDFAEPYRHLRLHVEILPQNLPVSCANVLKYAQYLFRYKVARSFCNNWHIVDSLLFQRLRHAFPEQDNRDFWAVFSLIHPKTFCVLSVSVKLGFCKILNSILRFLTLWSIS